MDKVLYTIGYGLLEGTHKERKASFQNRLTNIQRGIGKPICIMDIRKWGSGSRNGKWCSWDGMRGTIKELGEKFVPHQYPFLANEFGSTAEGFRKYRKRIRRHSKKSTRSLELILFDMGTRPDMAYILLCGCKEAFKPNGTTPNCHRFIVAGELLKLRGPGWEVVHL